MGFATDDLNTLNIKLFPVYPAPPSVKAWQVPLFTVRYQAFMDENWDLTMQRVCTLYSYQRMKLNIQVVPYINGVNSVRIISILADTDFSLTCRAIKHLLYYGCLLLLDIFTFSAIYAPTAQFSSSIGSDENMQRECARYVNTLLAPQLAPSPTTRGQAPAAPYSSTRSDINERPSSSDTTTSATGTVITASGGGPFFVPDDVWPPMGDDAQSPSDPNDISTTTESAMDILQPHQVVDGVAIVELYASLKQGQSVKQWYAQHSRQLAHIDIRRFITFGIIKGFLYRVHKYAYATGFPKHSHHNRHHHLPGTGTNSGFSSRGPGTGANTPSLYATSAGDSEPLIGQRSDEYQYGTSAQGNRSFTYDEGEEDEDFIDDKSLSRYLDGMHCFDQICTELEVSEKVLMARLKRYPGEVLIIHR